MENTGQMTPQELKIQGLIDRYLSVRTADNASTAQLAHLDEDSLAAFAEGSLTERESKPVVSHLVDCSFCRHITSELVRLELAFAEDAVAVPVMEREPAKISEVLSGILSRIFGTNDGAVFAHNEDDEKKETDEEKNSDEKPS